MDKSDETQALLQNPEGSSSINTSTQLPNNYGNEHSFSIPSEDTKLYNKFINSNEHDDFNRYIRFKNLEEQIRKKKAKKKFKKATCFGKIKILLPKIVENKYILFVTQLIAAAIVIITIYLNTHQQINTVKQTIDLMQDNITIDRNSLGTISQQLRNLNDTLNKLNALLDELNVLQLQQEMNDTIGFFLSVNQSIANLQTQLSNDIASINQTYKYTITNMYNQSESVLDSLNQLNSTLWQKEIEIDYYLKNFTEFEVALDTQLYFMQNDISAFESKVNSNITYILETLNHALENISDYENYLHVVSCRVEANISQSISNNVPNRLQYNIISIDTLNGWDLINNQYIVPVSGYYHITGQMLYSSTSDTSGFILYVAKNNGSVVLGSGYSDKMLNSLYLKSVSLSGVTALLSAGEDISLYTIQGSGDTLTTHSDATLNWFDIIRIV